MDEEGVEGAAATLGAIERQSGPSRRKFSATRPFLFLIQHDVPCGLLLAATVCCPTPPRAEI